MLTSSDFAAIATSSIVVRQLSPTTFTGICTELAAFTLSSVACYHITFCSMLQMATDSEQTCAQSDLRRKRQRHRAVALAETRKAIEQPDAANQEVTLFVVLSLASDAVGGIQSPTTKHMLTAFTKFANDDNRTGRMHLEGFKTLLRICHETHQFREDSFLQLLVSDYFQKDPQAARHKLQHCNDMIRFIMLGCQMP